MRSLLTRLLAAMGLVTASRHRALEAAVDQVRADAQSWKARAREATERRNQISTDLRRQTELVEKLQQQVASIDVMRQRLGEAERDLLVAREQLMAVDVKLDILEGAANVLDVRTRAAISRQHTGTSAAS